MCLWVQLYGSDLHTVQSVARTFLEVFPNASMWETLFGADYLFVGSKDALEMSWETLTARLQEPGVAADLSRVGIRGPSDLLLHHLVDGARLRDWAAAGEIYRDDTSRLEFEAPRLVYRTITPNELEALNGLRAPALPGWLRLTAAGIPPQDRAALEAAWQGRREFWRGAVHGLRGETAESMQAFFATLQLAPHLVRNLPEYFVRASRETAARSLAAGDTLSLIRMLERAVALEPHLVESQNDVGTWLEATRRYAEAEAHYRAALQSSPRNPQTLLNLSHALAMQGKTDEAESQVRRLLAGRPGHYEGRLSLGNFLLQKQDFPGAVREYHLAIALDPKRPLGWLLLGSALRTENSPREAARAFESALDCDPESREARSMLAACYRTLGEEGKAARLLR